MIKTPYWIIMKFILSVDTRRLIQQSTGLDYMNQCSTTISRINTVVEKKHDYVINAPRDVVPRGSLYFQMGRIMRLRTVKSYLKGI